MGWNLLGVDVDVVLIPMCPSKFGCKKTTPRSEHAADVIAVNLGTSGLNANLIDNLIN